MSLTIIFSGPESTASQVRNALASAGLTVEDTEHDHGLPGLPSGEVSGQPVGFTTVQADEVDLGAATAVAASLGHSLRMHHETPVMGDHFTGDSPLTALAATVAELQREVKELRDGR